MPNTISPAVQMSPAALRVETDAELHRAIKHLGNLGDGPLTHAIAELVPNDLARLNLLRRWRSLDPCAVRLIGADQFAPCLLMAVPRP